MEKERNKTIYINQYKIEIETLKKDIEERKEKELEKKSEHKDEVEKLKKKLQLIYLEKAYKSKPEDNPEVPTEENKEIKEHKCSDCNFKTNWSNNMTEHKRNCKNTNKIYTN